MVIRVQGIRSEGSSQDIARGYRIVVVIIAVVAAVAVVAVVIVIIVVIVVIVIVIVLVVFHRVALHHFFIQS